MSLFGYQENWRKEKGNWSCSSCPWRGVSESCPRSCGLLVHELDQSPQRPWNSVAINAVILLPRPYVLELDWLYLWFSFSCFVWFPRKLMKQEREIELTRGRIKHSSILDEESPFWWSAKQCSTSFSSSSTQIDKKKEKWRTKKVMREEGVKKPGFGVKNRIRRKSIPFFTETLCSP